MIVVQVMMLPQYPEEIPGRTISMVSIMDEQVERVTGNEARNKASDIFPEREVEYTGDDSGQC
jgi:hypothetical protein